jgi:hypothetical protein
MREQYKDEEQGEMNGNKVRKGETGISKKLERELEVVPGNGYFKDYIHSKVTTYTCTDVPNKLSN